MQPSTDQLNLNILSKEETDTLDSKITLEELHNAALCSHKGKSLGINGPPLDLYLALWYLLGHIWLYTINETIFKGCFHKYLNTALITVLPKPAKDHSDCSNYRHISLIYINVKIYAEVIVRRLQSVIHELIDQDQSGYITGHLASDKVHQVLHIIAESLKLETPSSLLFINAFDRLELSYSWYMLKKRKFW